MGKKEIHKDKNVFKVATARSVKLKAKAQKIINPKKIESKGIKISNENIPVNIERLMLEYMVTIKSKAKLDATKKETIKKNTKPLVSKVTPAQMNATVSKMEQMQL